MTNKYDTAQYMSDVMKTVSEIDGKDVWISLPKLISALESTFAPSAVADQIKRAIFYKKDAMPKQMIEKRPDENERISSLFETPSDRNLLHGILGVVSEIHEILEPFILYGYCRDIPELNEQLKNDLKEEFGDLLWYISLSLHSLDLTFEEVMEANIRKLKTRYGEKFSEEKASDRNTDAEQEAIKGEN